MINILYIWLFLTDFVGNQPMHDPRYEGEQTNGHHETEPHMEQGYSDEGCKEILSYETWFDCHHKGVPRDTENET